MRPAAPAHPSARSHPASCSASRSATSGSCWRSSASSAISGSSAGRPNRSRSTSQRRQADGSASSKGGQVIVTSLADTAQWACSRPPPVPACPLAMTCPPSGPPPGPAPPASRRLPEMRMVLDHQHRPALIHQPVQHAGQAQHIFQVLPDRWLVQDVETARRGFPAQLAGDLEPLRLPARERIPRLAQHQVAQPHLPRRLQRPAQARIVAKQVDRPRRSSAQRPPAAPARSGAPPRLRPCSRVPRQVSQGTCTSGRKAMSRVSRPLPSQAEQRSASWPRSARAPAPPRWLRTAPAAGGVRSRNAAGLLSPPWIGPPRACAPARLRWRRTRPGRSAHRPPRWSASWAPAPAPAYRSPAWTCPSPTRRIPPPALPAGSRPLALEVVGARAHGSSASRAARAALRVLHAPLAAQPAAGEAVALRHFLRRPLGNDLPAFCPAPGPMSIKWSALRITCGSCSTTMTVLPSSRSAFRALDQGLHFSRVQPARRLVQQHGQRGQPAAQQARQPDALRLSRRERPCRAVQVQITQADLDQKPQPLADRYPIRWPVSRRAGSIPASRCASSTSVICSSSWMLLPPSVTARYSAAAALPPQAGQAGCRCTCRPHPNPG